MVHRRDLDGEVLVFGNQGALWLSAMTWWDHDTGSVWSQPLGEAIMGPRTGATLELVASNLTSWQTWREAHPETLTLDAPAQRPRFLLENMTIVVDFAEEVGIYPVAELWSSGPANDVIAGVPIAVVTDPGARDRWAVLARLLGDRTLTLTLAGDDLVDEETWTTWDPITGRALAGPLEGEALAVLPGFTAFESRALAFWPDAKVWGR